MEESKLIHTYIDDIKFQLVKGDNKRTPFSSTEEQIQAKCKHSMEEIERDRKLAKSEHTRQQTVFEKKLGQLQKMKQDLGIAQPRAGRRHSVPHNFYLASPELRSPVLASLSVHSEIRLEDGNNATKQKPPKKKPSLKISGENQSKPTLSEMRRRMSCDSAAEVNREALNRFQRIMTGNARRATIAEGATSGNLLPHPQMVRFQSPTIPD